MEEFDQYIPPLWVMCLESVAHLLVMLNFSTNFIIYCSVSAPFKRALSKVILGDKGQSSKISNSFLKLISN